MRRRSIDWIGKKQKIHFNKYWSEKKTFATSVEQKKSWKSNKKSTFVDEWLRFCFVLFAGQQSEVSWSRNV